MDTVNVIEGKKQFQDCDFVELYKFDSIDKTIPIYEVKSIHGLNQIIGYLKYNNKLKNILYRGETKLHTDMRPSLYRKICSQEGLDTAFNKMGKMVNGIMKDEAFCKYAGFDKLTKNGRSVRRVRLYYNIMDGEPHALMLWTTIGLHCGSG